MTQALFYKDHMYHALCGGLRYKPPMQYVGFYNVIPLCINT